VLRDPLPLRAHVPMGEGKRKGAGDLRSGCGAGQETMRQREIFGLAPADELLKTDRRNTVLLVNHLAAVIANNVTYRFRFSCCDQAINFIRVFHENLLQA